MISFTAAAVIAATDASNLATANVLGDNRSGQPPIGAIGGRYPRTWTKPSDTDAGISLLPNPSRKSKDKSTLLTNRWIKEGKEGRDGIEASGYNHDANNTRENQHGGEDLGILSQSRKLNPIEDNNGTKSSAEEERKFFDHFGVRDRDRNEFYSICDPTVEDEYLCPRCDAYPEDQTVGDFDCVRIECYEIDSRCPNNMMAVCRYDTLTRMFDVEESLGSGGNTNHNGTLSSYRSEKCRKIVTKLSKTDRDILPNEESSWEFSYCLRYNIAEDDEDDARNTCEMEVDGIVCNSCLLDTVELLDPSFVINSTGNATREEFCVTFDCGNTLLGYSGRFCNAGNLAANSIDYFIYRSLPCDGGCNLCGDRTEEDPHTMMMMKYRDSSFVTPEFQPNEMEYLNRMFLPPTTNCFQSQWAALTSAYGNSYCTSLQSEVEASCGCTAMELLGPSEDEALSNSSSVNGLKNATNEDDDNGETAESGSNAIMTTTNFQIVCSTLVAATSLIGFGLTG